MLDDVKVLSIIEKCRADHNGRINFLWIKEKDVLDYINSRFSDSDSFQETIYRIENNIEEKPTCPVCGKKVKFQKACHLFSAHCSSACSARDKAVQEKIKKTNLQKYGCENPHQNAEIKAKAKQTNIKKYGCENPFANTEVKEKIKQTNIKKYGCENPGQSKELRAKREKTNRKKFGCKYPAQNKEILQKMQNTCMDRYGFKNPTENKEILKKVQDTCMDRLGCKYPAQNIDVKDKIYKAKKAHNSFNTSKAEEKTFIKLKEVFGEENVLRQYKSDVYPFACDFYIKTLNLYIELNFHWTHGGHPFDSLNEDDHKKLNHWKSKNTKFYDNAVEVWTQRDLLKIKTAILNHLNYIIFYKEEELIQWMDFQSKL